MNMRLLAAGLAVLTLAVWAWELRRVLRSQPQYGLAWDYWRSQLLAFATFVTLIIAIGVF